MKNSSNSTMKGGIALYLGMVALLAAPLVVGKLMIQVPAQTPQEVAAVQQ